jgi:4-diphosphocytidyl-2-C-methyl-D-erythritol kinase
MICFPNAKINLGLNVVEKRADGFHNIETVFFPVQWQDVLEILPSNDYELEIKGLEIEGDIESNLITKVYRVIESKYDIKPVKVILLKNIPMGGGLGGGSADAAFMIRALNDYFQLNISEDDLEEMLRPLGSDCAFFVRNKPVYAYGKGDQFESVDVDLSNYKIAVVNPKIHVGTAEAYGGLSPKFPEMNIREVLKMPIEKWKDHLYNDFESTIFKAHQEIKDLKDKLYELGAVYACMSGSGASVFGIFEKDKELDLKKAFPNYENYCD